MDASTIACFVGASAALTLAPGPDNIFVITQGITRGRKAAVVTALGMCSGITIHTLAAAFGISAIFYSSSLAFQAVKFAGAAYLVYLAVMTIMHRTSMQVPVTEPTTSAANFRRGFLMNVLNPKVALFFLAFLPQFVPPHSNHIPLHMLVLGMIFMLQAVVIFSTIGYFSGGIGTFFLSRPKAARYFDWATASIFAVLGARLAFAHR